MVRTYNSESNFRRLQVFLWFYAIHIHVVIILILVILLSVYICILGPFIEVFRWNIIVIFIICLYWLIWGVLHFFIFNSNISRSLAFQKYRHKFLKLVMIHSCLIFKSLITWSYLYFSFYDNWCFFAPFHYFYYRLGKSSLYLMWRIGVITAILGMGLHSTISTQKNSLNLPYLFIFINF